MIIFSIQKMQLLFLSFQDLCDIGIFSTAY